MNGWEIFYLVVGLLVGGTLGGFGMAMLAAVSMSAGYADHMERGDRQ